MKIKTIKIKCRDCDSIDIYKYKIKIYDKCDNLITEGCTNKCGDFYFNASWYGIYKIIIINNNLFPKQKCLILYIDKKSANELLVTFNK